MRGPHVDRLLTGTALVLLLTAAPGAALAAPIDQVSIEKMVPAPGATEVTPDSGPSVVAKPAPDAVDEKKIPDLDAVDGKKVDIDAAVPVPEAAKTEPITVKDLLTSPARDIDPADQPVAEKLRDFVNGRLSQFVDRKEERAAVEAFYAGRSFSPLWLEKGMASERAKAVIARLKAAAQDGLDPADYATPDLAAAQSPEALAQAELKLTDAVLTYARHAQVGPVHYTRVSGDIYYKQDIPEPAEILAKVSKAEDVAAALDSYNPPQPGFKALKAKLAALRNGDGAQDKQEDTVRIPDGPKLRLGDKSSRVPLLRKRLNISGDQNDERYDTDVVEAVREFQKEKELTPDGVVGPNTLAVLNGKAAPREKAEDIIIANMLRWRWLPRQLGEPKLGDAYVMLNIPDFTVKVVKRGKTVWHTKVVVGKSSTPTPLLSETIKFITVNPTWNVPPSIVYNEYLPALQQDPTVMDRMGIKITQNRDGSVHMYQPPGDGNALGRIRFNFPNKFLVYQHDTPDKHLFKKTVRAYSHGCMRVEDPLKYGEVLLSIALPKENYTVERLRRMFGPSEININLPVPVPVHITYQTAFVDDAGKLEIRNDIYSRDSRLLALLGGSDRRIADIPVERPHHTNYERPPVDLPYGVVSSGGWSGGPSFLERLFGVGPSAPPPRRPERRVFNR